MSKLKAIGESIIVEIISQSDQERAELEKLAAGAGLLLAGPHDNPAKVHGAPILGEVYAMSEKARKNIGYLCDVGDRVIYDEKQPHGFMYDDKKLLRINWNQVQAKVL